VRYRRCGSRAGKGKGPVEPEVHGSHEAGDARRSGWLQADLTYFAVPTNSPKHTGVQGVTGTISCCIPSSEVIMKRYLYALDLVSFAGMLAVGYALFTLAPLP